MPQGVSKKKKPSVSIKKKGKIRQVSKKHKPQVSKKLQGDEATKVKKIITKSVHKKMEEQLRALSSDRKVKLSSKKTSVDPNRMPPPST